MLNWPCGFAFIPIFIQFPCDLIVCIDMYGGWTIERYNGRNYSRLNVCVWVISVFVSLIDLFSERRAEQTQTIGDSAKINCFRLGVMIEMRVFLIWS